LIYFNQSPTQNFKKFHAVVLELSQLDTIRRAEMENVTTTLLQVFIADVPERDII